MQKSTCHFRQHLTAMIFCQPFPDSAQKRISGAVTGANHAPVTNAQASVKSKTVVMRTDDDRQFNIVARTGQTIVISLYHINYFAHA